MDLPRLGCGFLWYAVTKAEWNISRRRQGKLIEASRLLHDNSPKPPNPIHPIPEIAAQLTPLQVLPFRTTPPILDSLARYLRLGALLEAQSLSFRRHEPRSGFPPKRDITRPALPTSNIHVMTPDGMRPTSAGGHGYKVADDLDLLAGLWEEARFARLPCDAPSELRDLVEDIENPKRVYAIHKASRRHNFQLLVQR